MAYVGWRLKGSRHSGRGLLRLVLRVTSSTQSKRKTGHQLYNTEEHLPWSCKGIVGRLAEERERGRKEERVCMCVFVCVCVGVLLLEGELRPSHHWPGAQASQPCVCSCDLSCTSWSGFCNGKIIKRGGGREGDESTAKKR